jgi:tRNA nucleotidyltransferase (CCA-adding enzyme)
MSLATATPLVTHSDVAAFATDRVNLSREKATIYREQVRNLREKMDRFIADHPDVGLVKMLLSGSLAKGTALRTLNDIDVAVYVKAKAAPVDEAALLQWLAERLREAYPQMSPDQISPGNHAVRISFRGTGLDVDVVPVHYEGDSQDRGYLYARDTGERILTSIPLHIQFTRTRKDQQPDHFAQVVRLVKWWVRQRKSEDASFRLKSFMVEMIVAHVSDTGGDFSDYHKGLETVFQYLVKSQLKQRISFSDYYKSSALPKPAAGVAIEIFDPVNENNNVGEDYSDADRANIASNAEDALDALAEARFATTKGRAIECWQDVLGSSFKV